MNWEWNVALSSARVDGFAVSGSGDFSTFTQALFGATSSTLTPTWYSAPSEVQYRTSALAMESVMCMRMSEPGDRKNGRLSFKLEVPTSRMRACTELRGCGL